MPLLTASGICKSYSGVRALRGVSFELESGEVHALIGENGAGKSTLIKVITGAIAADSGSIAIDGKPAISPTPAVMKRLGVAAIYQQPALFGTLTVAENIALAVEHRAAFKKVDWRWRNLRLKITL